jgi:hypothetical protein
LFGQENEKRFRLKKEGIVSLFNLQCQSDTDVWIAFTDNEDVPEFFYAPIFR